MCTRSYSQLRAMFDEYQKFTDHPIEDDLKKEYSGDVLNSFLAIVGCIKDKQAYFANVLMKAMKGLGTKESALIRVVVSRCEIDMVQIKQKFEVLAKKTLADYISVSINISPINPICILFLNYKFKFKNRATHRAISRSFCWR